MYDETIVAYQDLRVVLANPVPADVPLERAIVIDGRTVGTWKRTIDGRTVVVHATLFGPLTPGDEQDLERACTRFGAFLRMPASLAITRAA